MEHEAGTPLVAGGACEAPLAPASEQDHGLPPAQGGGLVFFVQEEEEEEKEEGSSEGLLFQRPSHSEMWTHSCEPQFRSLFGVFVLPEEHSVQGSGIFLGDDFRAILGSTVDSFFCVSLRLRILAQFLVRQWIQLCDSLYFSAMLVSTVVTYSASVTVLLAAFFSHFLREGGSRTLESFMSCSLVE